MAIPAINPYRLPTPEDLPPNVANWVPKKERAVLLIHDMQNYFMQPFPTELRNEIVQNIVNLRAACKRAGVPIAYSAQPGSMTEKQRGLLRDFWGPGMKLAPEDRDVLAELKPEASDWTVTKWRYSAFFNNDLLQQIRTSGRDQLILCGVYAHIGVLTTAIEAYSNDIEVFLVPDAIGDFKEEYHNYALQYASRTCATIVMNREVIRCLA